MGEKDDGLGLSLSLRCPTEMNLPHHHQPPPLPFPLSLMHSSSPLAFMLPDKPPFSTFLHSPHGHGEARSYLGGIDVNRPAPTADQDEEVAVSSPNSTVSSVSGKRSEREIENEAEKPSSSQEDDVGEAARKKLRLSKEQAAILEETFKEQNTLNPKQKLALANQLNLRPRQVEVWFQNRRARTKLKQTEVDCDYLRRCCENLTEENRRLQKEVNDLRALKLSPQLYMNMNPPTTLTMCPSCERVAVSSTSSSSATASSTIGRTGRNRNMVAPPLQRPSPANSWAAVISHQPLDIHRPRS